jgi:hypothetical protein
MARQVDGVALGTAAAGALLVYAGITGKSVPHALQAIISGKNPAAVKASYQITGTAAAGGAGSSPGGSAAPGDTGAHGASAAQNQALARLLVSGSHPSWAAGQQWADWVSLWNQESGWNNLALNSSSGAFGIAQALGHGLAGTAGKYGNQYPSKAANDGQALAQEQWGIEYIARSYGSPSAAWAHEIANNWY